MFEEITIETGYIRLNTINQFDLTFIEHTTQQQQNTTAERKEECGGERGGDRDTNWKGKRKSSKPPSPLQPYLTISIVLISSPYCVSTS